MKVTVQVTQEHISKGKPNDVTACPVALALIDALSGTDLAACKVSVGAVMAAVYPNGIYADERLRATVSGAAQAFILSFDNDEPVEPFECELEFLEHLLISDI